MTERQDPILEVLEVLRDLGRLPRRSGVALRGGTLVPPEQSQWLVAKMEETLPGVDLGTDVDVVWIRHHLRGAPVRPAHVPLPDNVVCGRSQAAFVPAPVRWSMGQLAAAPDVMEVSIPHGWPLHAELVAATGLVPAEIKLADPTRRPVLIFFGVEGRALIPVDENGLIGMSPHVREGMVSYAPAVRHSLPRACQRARLPFHHVWAGIHAIASPITVDSEARAVSPPSWVHGDLKFAAELTSDESGERVVLQITHKVRPSRRIDVTLSWGVRAWVVVQAEASGTITDPGAAGVDRIDDTGSEVGATVASSRPGTVIAVVGFVCLAVSTAVTGLWLAGVVPVPSNRLEALFLSRLLEPTTVVAAVVVILARFVWRVWRARRRS